MFRKVLGLICAVVIFAFSAPATAQNTLQFCRDVPPDFNCVAPTNSFATNDGSVWILFLLANSPGGRYEIKVEWVAPDGSLYGSTSFQGSNPAGAPTRWRFRLSVRGQRAETLPGSWEVRIFVNGRVVQTGKFALALVGTLKVYVPSLGPLEVRAGFTKSSPGRTPPEESITRVSTQDELYSFAAFRSIPLEAGVAVVPKARWSHGSSEVYQWSPGSVGLGTGWTDFWWAHLLPKEKMQAGTYTVEWFLDATLVAKETVTIEAP